MKLLKTLFKVFAPYLEKKEKDRTYLLKMVPKGSACCEVGVWKGRFSEQILEIVGPKKLHLIDPWKFMSKYSDRWYGGTVAKSQKDMDNIYDDVRQMFKNDRRVVVHRGPSQKIVKKFKDNYFDFVYIDGDHSYDFVKKDLENFLPKVKRGGIIAGDDYFSLWTLFHGLPVKKAVDDFLKSHRCDPISLHGQFVLRKRVKSTS